MSLVLGIGLRVLGDDFLLSGCRGSGSRDLGVVLGSFRFRAGVTVTAIKVGNFQ